MELEGNLREILLGLIVGMPSVGVINSLIFGWQLRSYLSTSPRIESWQDLERFKQIVSAQMYATLAQIGFLIIPYPAFAYGVWMGELRLPVDLVFIIVPSAILVIVGAVFKQIDAQAKSLPVAEEFQGEYQRVAEAWVKKPLPDW